MTHQEVGCHWSSMINNGDKQPYQFTWGSWSEERVHAGTISLFGLGCCHSMLPLQDDILAISVRRIEDGSVAETKKLDFAGKQHYTRWSIKLQKAWDTPITAAVMETRERWCQHSDRHSQIEGGSRTHSGDWLHALPITALGLRRIMAVTQEPRETSTSSSECRFLCREETRLRFRTLSSPSVNFLTMGMLFHEQCH